MLNLVKVSLYQILYSLCHTEVYIFNKFNLLYLDLAIKFEFSNRSLKYFILLPLTVSCILLIVFRIILLNLIYTHTHNLMPTYLNRYKELSVSNECQ